MKLDKYKSIISNIPDHVKEAVKQHLDDLDKIYRMKQKTFTLTEDHIKLLSSMWTEWDTGCYQGAPVIDEKRPYGNKGSYEMVGHILGWWSFYDKEALTKEEENAAKKLHRETETALQIVLSTKSFLPGTYKRLDFGNGWERVVEFV